MNAATQPATGFAQEIEAMVLARAQRGDMQAFAQLYQRFADACFQLCLRMLGQRQQAEDLVQEIFLKMMHTIRSYRGDAPFGAWLKRLSVNACIDALRRQQPTSAVDIEVVVNRVGGEAPEPGSAIDAWSLLSRLTPRARAIVVLHELEGYTHAELASMFNQSESYSKSILARALKRLHGLIESQQVPPCPIPN